MDKQAILKSFRQFADINFSNIQKSKKSDYKERAKEINKLILEQRDLEVEKIVKDKSSVDKLSDILLINYVSDLVMLEYRNKFWNYDYMAFSRRIGEIWEPFCKLPFKYPKKKKKIVEPLSFSDVQNDLECKIKQMVDSLVVSDLQKDRLRELFSEMWNLIDSGNINLSLDLHFFYKDFHYNVDYKSGFNSNEKGNTNRLLLVGSIYKSLKKGYKNLIFVRQSDNNHYLETLKNSGFWEVYIGDAAYKKIYEFTGFDLKMWMKNYMDWHNDISEEFKEYLEKNDLLKYLTW